MADTDQKGASAQTRSPRWMRVMLVLSLALNLLFVGLVAGTMLGQRGPSGRDAAGGDFRGQPLIRALEASDRRAVLDRLRRDTNPPRDRIRGLRGRFQAYLEALRADTFDISDVEAVLLEQRTSVGGHQERIDAILLGELSEMSAEERRAYADRLEETIKRGGRRRGSD